MRQAIERDGRSDRAVSVAIGRSASYISGILREGKEPGVETMVRLAEELNASLSWIMFGIEMGEGAERLLRLYTSLTDAQRDQFLQMAESVVSMTAQKP